MAQNQLDEPVNVSDIETLTSEINNIGSDVLPKELRPKEVWVDLADELLELRKSNTGVTPSTDEFSTNVIMGNAEEFNESIQNSDVMPHELATYLLLCTEVSLTEDAEDLI